MEAHGTPDPPYGLADRLLLARQESTDERVLAALAGSEYSFVWEALAANPRTPTAALAELCTRSSSRWNDNRLLFLIARHPAADRQVLLAVLTRVSAILESTDGRPYAAVLALADRPELRPDELVPLAALPGASRRLGRGLRRHLAARPASGHRA